MHLYNLESLLKFINVAISPIQVFDATHFLVFKTDFSFHSKASIRRFLLEIYLILCSIAANIVEARDVSIVNRVQYVSIVIVRKIFPIQKCLAHLVNLVLSCPFYYRTGFKRKQISILPLFKWCHSKHLWNLTLLKDGFVFRDKSIGPLI